MTKLNKKPAEEAKSPQTPTIVWLLLLSVVMASANTLLYKATLDAFSSPTTNYGFFISQFSTLFYTVQAVTVSTILVINDYDSIKAIFATPWPVFVYMGLLDAASATVGAIAGVNCPGMLQTVLNQLVIPITMIGSSAFLNSKFEAFQIWGCVFILLGAIIASCGYLFYKHSSSESAQGDDHGIGDGSAVAIGTAALSAGIVLYFISVIPSALSNIYKESKMKEQDMNEVHTSTVVSFWQLWFGFFFLPLMSLPSLGGLTYTEMSMQLSDGFTCFLGTNPNDPAADCSNAAYLLMAYIVVNFFYNILMLAITKRGSAVLLVISQALSLPVTNIAFTLKIFMGDAAEPLTAVDLLGLVLVCIGFLTYSGFGLAHNFMVAQGPPGQMAYVHFEDVSEVIVSTEMALRPDELVRFLVGSILQQQSTQQAHRARTHSVESASSALSYNGMGGAAVAEEKGALIGNGAAGGSRGYSSVESGEAHAAHDTPQQLTQSQAEPTQLSATMAALEVARQAVVLLEAQVRDLRNQSDSSLSSADGTPRVTCGASLTGWNGVK